MIRYPARSRQCHRHPSGLHPKCHLLIVIWRDWGRYAPRFKCERDRLVQVCEIEVRGVALAIRRNTRPRRTCTSTRSRTDIRMANRGLLLDKPTLLRPSTTTLRSQPHPNVANAVACVAVKQPPCKAANHRATSRGRCARSSVKLLTLYQRGTLPALSKV